MAFIFAKLKLTNHVFREIKIIPRVAGLASNTVGPKDMASEAEKAEHASKGDKAKESVFDQIISRKVRADIIYEDDHCVAFNDVNPQAPIHFLVVPKKRITMLDEATEDDIELLSQLLLTARALAKSKMPNGYRLVINNGKDGCQSVYHLHVHILGGRKMHWPPG